MLLGDSICRQVEAWNLLLAVAFDVKLLAQDTLRRLNNGYVWNTETLNWDADNLQLCCRWFGSFSVAFLKPFHLADFKANDLFFADPRGDYHKQWMKQQTGCVWTKCPCLLFMPTFAQLSPKHLRFSEFCGPDNVLLTTVVPNRWVANSSLNSLLSLKFLELRISTFCVTSAKPKHRL